MFNKHWALILYPALGNRTMKLEVILRNLQSSGGWGVWMKMNKVAYDALSSEIENLIKHTKVRRRIISKKQKTFSHEVLLMLND